MGKEKKEEVEKRVKKRRKLEKLKMNRYMVKIYIYSEEPQLVKEL